MDFGSLTVFNLMKTKLNYLSERQSVLAENVANADTPGYKAKDVEKPDFSKLLAGTMGQPARNLPMAVTHTGHVGTSTSTGSMKVIKRDLTDELNPNGNNVSIEEEVAKVSANQGDYNLALSLYSKTISLFKTAIGGQGGGG